jgi:hypothetical protein
MYWFSPRDGPQLKLVAYVALIVLRPMLNRTITALNECSTAFARFDTAPTLAILARSHARDQPPRMAA